MLRGVTTRVGTTKGRLHFFPSESCIPKINNTYQILDSSVLTMLREKFPIIITICKMKFSPSIYNGNKRLNQKEAEKESTKIHMYLGSCI